MKFLHSSDWHLGRQFHNVSLLEDQAHVLNQLVDIAIQQRVDAVLLAGDIYDRTVPPAAAVSLLDNILTRLCHDHGIPVIMIAGNHDSPERIGFAARQLTTAGLHIFGPLQDPLDPVVLHDQYGEVAIYGIPYADPATVRDCFGVDVRSHDQAMAFLTEQIRTHNGSNGHRRTAIISHCFLDGGDESESERPLSVGGADRVSPEHFLAFNYTALGHLHGPQYKRADFIRYSGSILKYSFSEQHHHKSVAIVEMDAAGHCSIDKKPLLPLRDMRCIEGNLEDILNNARSDPAPDDYLLVRLTDTHAILDIMGKLRDVYPNVLHLERPGLQSLRLNGLSSKQQLQKSEMAMCADFYAQVKGEPMSTAQTEVLTNIIEQLQHGEA